MQEANYAVCHIGDPSEPDYPGDVLSEDDSRFQVEDVRTGARFGEKFYDVYDASEAALDRDELERGKKLAEAVAAAGRPVLAEDLVEGLAPRIALRRLVEVGEGGSEAARIIAAAGEAGQIARAGRTG